MKDPMRIESKSPGESGLAQATYLMRMCLPLSNLTLQSQLTQRITQVGHELCPFGVPGEHAADREARLQLEQTAETDFASSIRPSRVRAAASRYTGTLNRGFASEALRAASAAASHSRE